MFDKGFMDDGNGRRVDFKNTLIILTTNVGTDIIMESANDPRYRDDPAELAVKLRPELLNVFPAALLGRIVSVPYYPLSPTMLTESCACNSTALGGASATTIMRPSPTTKRSSTISFQSATTRIQAGA